jgi:hypothetical protein
MSGASSTQNGFGRFALMVTGGVFISTTATVFTPESGASTGSLFSALDLLKSTHMADMSNTVRLATRRHRVTERRNKNRFCPNRVCAKYCKCKPSPQTKKRADSGLELVSPSTQPEPMSQQEVEGMLLAALPADVRAQIYQVEFARNEPVDFVHYFNSLDFEFDLRTPVGVADFHAWHANLGSHACNVASLTLKHWTTHWSSPDNTFLTSEDATHFARGSLGELIMFRAVPTPTTETCACGLPYLLAQHDQVFELRKHAEIRNMPHFINCLRANEADKKLTRVDAASTFASMLDEYSQFLFQDHARGGTQCSGCFMPRLYLTGHLSTSTANEGSDVVFDASALSNSC